MTLADLIDLEAQLARDRDADPATVAARDRALVGGARLDPRRRDRLLARWLTALRESDAGRLPGRAIEGALRALRAVLALAGALLGWAAGTAVLSFTGGHPVNVWDFLLVLVGLQVLLLAALLASFFLPLAALGAPLRGLLSSGLAGLWRRLAARLQPGGRARAEEWRVLWHRLRSRRSLYHRVEPWLLLSLTQSFGLAFNVGALLACLRLVAFSDVAFGWSTTLVELDAARFHALIDGLAAPWRGLWPAAVPSRELVEATRYSRLESAYLLSGAGRTARPDLVGGWWPFLVAALVTYGLLPRAVTLLVARLRAARLLARLPLDDAEVSRLVHRLVEPSVETAAPSPEAPGPAPPPVSAAAPAERGGGPCALVLWRDVPGGPALEAAVSRALRRPVARVVLAGGRDHEEGGRDWREAAAGAEPVVVAEAFEPPDRAALRLLAELRRALGPRRLLRVLLVDEASGAPRPAQPADVRLWRDGLARLEDPFLAVEPLGVTP